jgi:hypothetical protein
VLRAELDNEEYDDEDDEMSPKRWDRKKVPCHLIRWIVLALGTVAQKQRELKFQSSKRELGTLVDTTWNIDQWKAHTLPFVTEYDMACSLDTYFQCIRGLVAIAESSIQILPGDTSRFYDLASAIVSQFVYCLHPLTPDSDAYLGLEMQGEEGNEMRLANPLRYASCILKATALAKKQASFKQPTCKLQLDRVQCRALAAAMHQTLENHHLPDDVREAVRALFIRNLVDLRITGFGYGDFLLWCGYTYEISPLEPALFW